MLVKLLGPVEIAETDGWRRSGPPKQACVLASLALTPRTTLSIDTLAHRIWGSDAPVEKRNVIYGHITRLRRLLSIHEAVELRRVSMGGYRLEIAADQIDVFHMRALAGQAREAHEMGEVALAARRWREAAELWHGPALAGIEGSWAARTRRKLHDEHIAVLADLSDCELALGRHAEVAADLVCVVEQYPLAENLIAPLMLALYRCGRVTEALARYADTRNRLREELGNEPGKRLRELHQRILRQDPELVNTAGAIERVRPPAGGAIQFAPFVPVPPSMNTNDDIGRRKIHSMPGRVLDGVGGVTRRLATHVLDGVVSDATGRSAPHVLDGVVSGAAGRSAPRVLDGVVSDAIGQLATQNRALGFAMTRLSHEAATRLGLQPVDQQCVDLLHRTGPIHIARLARLTGLSAVSVAEMVDRLERAGFAHRQPAVWGGCKIVVVPLPSAEAKQVSEPLRERLDKLNGQYSEAELALLTDYLEQVAGLMQEHADALGSGVPLRKSS
ncbi:BTAD domain-containing putative transcriptional regulator [Streptosporangium sp. CA-135522]|uniref:BTAD domain-containing putative transcriptional regulator n=1 Tax=Streptosporangium sp. CA-135522 TaxID=3240072 RepID=UPI003D931156